MELFTALHNDDTTMVGASVDVNRAWASVRENLTEPGDSLLAEVPWSDRLLASLTGEGKIRQRWMKTKVVINKTHFFGDSATVEVSFLDRETGMHFYNRMGLVRRDNRWVIVAFRTL